MQQQQQQQQPSQPEVINLANVTTEQIQKCLDENKQLIMAILEQHSQGKYSESAPYQTRLQNNLLYLSRVADAKPQDPATSSKTSPQSAAPQQELFGQPLQAVLAQPSLLPPNLVFQLTDQPLQQLQQKQNQLQLPYLQQQQLNHGQMSTRQGSTGNMYQAMQTGLGNNFMSMTGNMQDGLGTGDSRGKSAYGHNNEDTQNMRLM
ncbi:hypothetical protein SLA2020_219280 [Shorea laevis]